jgi:hypothetical protein
LPYQQIVCHLVVDFANVLSLWDGMSPTDFLIRILRKAAAFVFAVREALKHDTPTPTPTPSARPEVAPGFGEQPLNWTVGTRVPLRRGRKCDSPTYSLEHSTPDYEELFRRHRAYVTEGESREPIPSSGTVRELQRHAYVLLNSIHVMLGETSELIDWLKNDDVIRLLLTCGVYADSASMVASQAFRLLYHALYVEEDADPIKPDFNISQERRAIVEEFAGAFYFSNDITEQMIAAFPIFWEHHYESLDTKGTYEDVFVPAAWGCPEFTVHRPVGCTPLQYYGYCLLDEPPVSDILNRYIMDLLVHLNEKRKAALE